MGFFWPNILIAQNLLLLLKFFPLTLIYILSTYSKKKFRVSGKSYAKVTFHTDDIDPNHWELSRAINKMRHLVVRGL